MGKLTHLVWNGFASYIYVTCLLQCTNMIQPMLIFIVGSPLPFLSQTPKQLSQIMQEILPGSYTKRRYRNWTYYKSQYRAQHCTTAHQ